MQDAVEVKAPKGSLFLWDGELLHCNAPKSTAGYRVGLVGHFTRPWNIIAQQARLLFVSSAFTFPKRRFLSSHPRGHWIRLESCAWWRKPAIFWFGRCLSRPRSPLARQHSCVACSSSLLTAEVRDRRLLYFSVFLVYCGCAVVPLASMVRWYIYLHLARKTARGPVDDAPGSARAPLWPSCH